MKSTNLVLNEFKHFIVYSRLLFNFLLIFRYIDESVQTGSVILQIGAFDPDSLSSNLTSSFQYAIVSQQPDIPLFTLDSTNGYLSFETPGLNREEIDAYNLTVSVRDQGNLSLNEVEKATPCNVQCVAVSKIEKNPKKSFNFI